ncbi:unnamed protein product [Rodentolepis nana]|uniref:Uncharacterized protein n=1 Tax=Rodentolepis nana TaxID=102285 RepID=A0A0R3TX67_RODNA|nr:unnamed protein product [Rodentolepis nana]
MYRMNAPPSAGQIMNNNSNMGATQSMPPHQFYGAPPPSGNCAPMMPPPYGYSMGAPGPVPAPTIPTASVMGSGGLPTPGLYPPGGPCVCISHSLVLAALSALIGFLNLVMSRLHDLATDLSLEVDRFASQIEEEKRKISDIKARFNTQWQQRCETEKQSLDLQNELERLKSCFVKCGPSSDATDLYLSKAQGVVRAAAQRMRDERMAILGEYQTKLDRCEMLFRRNTMMEDFISTWRKSLKEEKNIQELPQIIRKLSEDLAQVHSCSVFELLQKATSEPFQGKGDSNMDVTNLEETETMPPPQQPAPLALKPLNVASQLPDDALCNASNVGEFSMYRMRGGAEPSILNTNDFSRLGLDSTLTDRNCEFSSK